MEYPPYPSRIDKAGRTRDIDGRILTFKVLDEIVRPQSTKPDKLIYLQKIQFVQDGKIEYRLAYYIIGKKPKMLGKWVFGQYATFMNPDDFEYIIREAKRKGWLM